MILPSKHLSQDRALLTVGAKVLALLQEPMSVSLLWEKVPRRRAADQEAPSLRYDAFVLTLDLLFLMGAIEWHDGRLRRRSTS